MSLYTVFGGRGFIGSAIVAQLKAKGNNVWVPERDDAEIYSADLGTVIYCAGNGDCKNSPFDVFNANSQLLATILKSSTFKKLIYLSSTRVYMNMQDSRELDDILICSDDARRLFNLTKLVGEELCLRSAKPVVIVRPSNVYGVALSSPLFLPSITRNAITKGSVDMFISKDYAKDYVSVDDVASACIALSVCDAAIGQVINIASGINTTASAIAGILQNNTGCSIIWHDINFPRENFPLTDISMLRRFLPDYTPRDVLEDLESMVIEFKLHLSRDE